MFAHTVCSISNFFHHPTIVSEIRPGLNDDLNLTVGLMSGLMKGIDVPSVPNSRTTEAPECLGQQRQLALTSECLISCRRLQHLAYRPRCSIEQLNGRDEYAVACKLAPRGWRRR